MGKTLLDSLDRNARQRPEDPAYYQKEKGIWQATCWREYRHQVRLAAKAFLDFGAGPRTTVGVLGSNRPPWTISALAAMATGGAAAGIYTTNAASQVAYVLGHADAVVAVVEDGEQWRKIDAIRNDLPRLRRVVVMIDEETPDDRLAMSWSALLEHGATIPQRLLDERRAALAPEQLASLIYTSGTTGPPKGVMLSHANLTATARICGALLATTPADRALSYLPLAHVAEQALTIHLPVYNGYPVYFAESVDKMLDNLKETRPTLVFGVPRVWERLQAGIEARLSTAPRGRALLSRWAMRTGRRTAAIRNEGGQPGLWLRLREQLAAKLVHRKIQRALGLDQARICTSGAAPIAVEVLEYFAGLGIVLREVYGQSEDCGPTSWNRPGRTRFGTVGPPLPEVEVKIADDGEVLVRGPNVFLGYLKDPTATAAAKDADGWLHSGDIGRFDEDGYLLITGRKKEIMITSGGKNIAPNLIESALKHIALVGDAVLVADGRKFVSALLSLEPERAARMAAELGKRPEEMAADPVVEQHLASELEKVNQHLSRVEQVKAFRVLPRPLSIEAGELTPTLKVKRRVVEERYAHLIDSIYAPSA